MEDTTIYIPSRGRAADVRTFYAMPVELSEAGKVRVVVPIDEVSEYRQHHPNSLFKVLGISKKGIGKTRQWILDHCPTKYALMFDDDLYFYRRERPRAIKLVKATAPDMRHMLYMMVRPLSMGIVQTGLSSRVDSSHYLSPYRWCTRINNVHGFNIKEFAKTGLRFDEYRVMEDFHVTLSLLERGIPNACVYDYCWNQTGSNMKGGCSIYRNEETQAKAAHMLRDAHPKYVTVVRKKVIGATSWEGMKERTDVRINWRKAFPYELPHFNFELQLNVSKLKGEGII